MRFLRAPFALITRLTRWPVQFALLLMGKSGKPFWTLGLSDEIRYWKVHLSADGGEYADEFKERTDPETPLQPHLAKLLDECGATVPRVLDVGSGPLTSVGKIYQGRPLDLTATDPLATAYIKLIEQYDVSAPVRPTACAAEELVERFSTEAFDLTHARNSIDHSVDPVKAIESMLKVTKSGGYLYMHHAINEASRNHYSGLHQWNFFSEDGDFYVGSLSTKHNVSERFRDIATTKVAEKDEMITTLFKKH